MLSFSRVGPLGAFLMLCVVVLAVFLLGKCGDGPPPALDVPDPDAPELMTRDPRVEFIDEGAQAEQYPKLTSGELQQELFAWFQTPGRGMVADRQDTLEAEWVRHLLSDEVRPKLERLPGWVGGELPDLARVAEEPGLHRGKLVQVWGAVAAVEETDLPTEPARPAWRVRLDDEAGRPWTVVTTQPPPEEAKPGAWVKAFGVFVKLRPVENGRPSYLVLSAQKLVPSFPPVAAKDLSTEWAEEVDDSTLERSQRHPSDERAFWMLLNYVRTLGAEGYRAKVASGELVPVDRTGTLGARPLVDEPALHRFELVRMRVALVGGLAGFVSDQDLPENPGNIRSVYRGFVFDDQQRAIWVMSPLPPEAFDLKGRRLAILEGFFYKRRAQEKKTGGHYWLPIVVATSIRGVDLSRPPTNYAKWAAWIAIAGVVACLVLWAVLVRRSRRERAEVLRRHEERTARRGAKESASP